MPTIKEFIERGAYPTDDKGRALVPTAAPGVVATICATDKGGDCPLVGWIAVNGPALSWSASGSWGNHATNRDGYDLLPPPPRKVKVTEWAIVVDRDVHSSYGNRDAAERVVKGLVFGRIVELTGEYEEPWS